MLQQTQVGTATPYFKRWMRRFPDIKALAEAPVEDVLSHWQGLGYYARARNLHKAAKEIQAKHDGRLPEDFDSLLKLPGIGPYSAGAISSIAFGLPFPAVDGNVKRVLTRLDMISGDPDRAEASRKIHALATDLVQGPEPGAFNQALMEFGSLVCRPRSPRCDECVLSTYCRAYQAGRVEEFPNPKRRAAQRKAFAFAFVLENADGEVLLVRRSPSGLLGGLWLFPMIEAEAGEDPRALLRERFGMEVKELNEAGRVRHVFSHIDLSVRMMRGRLGGSEGNEGQSRTDILADGLFEVHEESEPRGMFDHCDAQRWVSLKGKSEPDLPVSTLMRKLLAIAVD